MSERTEPNAAPAPLFLEVFQRLKPHMTALDGLLKEQLTEFEPEIRDMVEYCVDTSGKRIRPTLVFLSGYQESGVIDESLVKAAAVVELVHLATLVHDDIMDGATVRRNRSTAGAAYGSAAAVLLGDSLFAHALHLASQFPTPEVCREVSNSTRRVCAGEIVQTLRRRSTTVTMQDYYRVIDLKTAELFRVSCHLGSWLAGHESLRVEASSVFGRHLGIAYQIYDDLADFFGEEARIGKTLGTDLQSGKMTLPLFKLAESLPEAEREVLFAEIRGERSPDLPARVAQMRASGVFDRVLNQIRRELRAAETVLEPWTKDESSRLLISLGEVLIAQVEALRPKSQPGYFFKIP